MNDSGAGCGWVGKRGRGPRSRRARAHLQAVQAVLRNLDFVRDRKLRLFGSSLPCRPSASFHTVDFDIDCRIHAPTWTSRVSDFGIRPRDHVPTTPPRAFPRATRAAVASRHASLAPFPRATTNPSPSGVGLGEREWRPRPAGPSRSQSRSGAPRRSMKERPRETLVPAARVDRPVGGLLTDRC